MQRLAFGVGPDDEPVYLVDGPETQSVLVVDIGGDEVVIAPDAVVTIEP